MVGRATRVWAVQEIDPISGDLNPDAQIYALKVSWVESTRKLEGEWYEILFEAAKGNSERLKRANECFLTAVTHGRVLIDGRRQDTSCIRRHQCADPDLSDTLPIKKLVFLPMDSDTVHTTISSLPRNWFHVLERSFARKSIIYSF